MSQSRDWGVNSSRGVLGDELVIGELLRVGVKGGWEGKLTPGGDLLGDVALPRGGLAGGGKFPMANSYLLVSASFSPQRS